MVLEIATIDVLRGRESMFEAAARRGLPLIAGSSGCRGAELRASIEVPARYRLLVLWDRVADHMEGFQTSPAFAQWRTLVREFFAEIPSVEHMTAVAAEPGPILAPAAGVPADVSEPRT